MEEKDKNSKKTTPAKPRATKPETSETEVVAATAQAPAETTPASANRPQNTRKIVFTSPQTDFRGSAFVFYFMSLAAGFLTLITFGLLGPAMTCWKTRWIKEHTYLNGKQLAFNGKAMPLLGKYMLWILLSIVTLGIYYLIWFKYNMYKWEVEHTYFQGAVPEEQPKFNNNTVSYTDGSVWGYFGTRVLCSFVTIITFSLGSYWAHCHLLRWEAKHQFVNGCKLVFRGKAWGLFGHMWLWGLLSGITFGIFSLWVPGKRIKWQVERTYVDLVASGATMGNASAEGGNVTGGVNTTSATSNASAAPAAPAGQSSVTGFVLSLCGLIMPVLGIVGFVMSIVALTKHYENRGLAIAGIVVGALIVVGEIVGVVLAIILMGNSVSILNQYLSSCAI